jgi:hypothetical protein
LEIASPAAAKAQAQARGAKNRFDPDQCSIEALYIFKLVVMIRPANSGVQDLERKIYFC